MTSTVWIAGLRRLRGFSDGRHIRDVERLTNPVVFGQPAAEFGGSDGDVVRRGHERRLDVPDERLMGGIADALPVFLTQQVFAIESPAAVQAARREVRDAEHRVRVGDDQIRRLVENQVAWSRKPFGSTPSSPDALRVEAAARALSQLSGGCRYGATPAAFRRTLDVNRLKPPGTVARSAVVERTLLGTVPDGDDPHIVARGGQSVGLPNRARIVQQLMRRDGTDAHGQCSLDATAPIGEGMRNRSTAPSSTCSTPSTIRSTEKRLATCARAR